MSTLVAVEDVIDVLGGVASFDEDDTPVLDRVITQVESLFLSQANRRERPFQAAQSARVEVHDGTGTGLLVLDYPIAALTSVLLGPDATAPAETLTVADVNVLRFAPGKATLYRVDGGTFRQNGEPRVVHVTYNAAADLPADAALAIQNVAVSIWRRRGSEDVTSDRLGGFSADYLSIAQADPLWQLALKAHWTPAFA